MDKIEVTQADRTLYHQLLSLGSVNLNRRRMGLPIVDGFELIAAHRLATRTDATPVATDVAALVEATKDLRDALAHMATPARVDPDKYFSEQVKAFGDAFGYGALMTTASALWRQSLGDLQGGEFAVGPCVTTAANQLKRLSAALTPFTKGQNDE